MIPCIPQTSGAYPVDAFPNVARKAILELVNNVQSPAELVGPCMLSVLSAVSQQRVKVLLPIGGQARPVSLYVLIVAGSGDRKTTIDNHLYRSVREHDQRIEEEYVRQLHAYERDHRIWASKERRLVRQIAEDEVGDESLRAKLDEHYECEPAKPRLRRKLLQNASERAVIDALAGSGESFSLIADEGGVVLNSPLFSNASFMNKCWDGGPFVLDRANGVSLSVRDARVTASVMVQPEVLDEFSKANWEVWRGSGGFARYLISCPISRKGWRFATTVQAEFSALDEFCQLLSELLEDSTQAQQVLEFDEEAKCVWVNFVNQVEVDIRPNGVLAEIGDFASKVGEITARVAAIFHFFDKSEGHISVGPLRRAIDIVCFHIDEFKRVFDSGSNIPQDQIDAGKIRDYVFRNFWSKGHQCVPRTYLSQNGPVRGKLRFDAALYNLQCQGDFWITVGASKKRYVWFKFNTPPINPIV